ncbi:hypothetical protein FGO68_gene59 [Halteria grandinella]|uniref:Phosphatidylinositol-4-phosphate 5-kinase n=1 Tax=Halteria grandinella TaxID=5974 RepID=A0A8J8T768_HALGN|nr:hypothetical protein FGO68_gene59 [Halteria grandinella]
MKQNILYNYIIMSKLEAVKAYPIQSQGTQRQTLNRNPLPLNDSQARTNSSKFTQSDLDYQMLSNEFDYHELLDHAETFGVKRFKDAIYRGEIEPESNKRHGKGVIVYKNGRVYEGEWLNDKRQGRGYERFANGNTYQGEFKEGKAHGKGLYQWRNGELYDGEWNEGVKEGYGVWKGTDGESYIGQWVGSKAEGYGVHVWLNGDRYEGEWRACLRHGNGTDFFSNQDMYIGQYMYGKPEGFGQYKWANGNSYQGTFKNGFKHGHGKWKKKPAEDVVGAKSNSYEGDYFMDKKNGWGYFEWESGNSYRGRYVEDERQGFGEMRWTDGSVYRGGWLKGVQNGVGVMMFPNGERKAGQAPRLSFMNSKRFNKTKRTRQQDEGLNIVEDEDQDDLVEKDTLPDIKQQTIDSHRIGRPRKTPKSTDPTQHLITKVQQQLSMSVDHGKMLFDNNLSDGNMLKYHDFELIHGKHLHQSIQQPPQYKQAYLKYQGGAINRNHSIRSTTRRSQAETRVSEQSPSRFTNNRMTRRPPHTNLSMSMVTSKINTHQSVMIANRAKAAIAAQRSNSRIPEYTNKKEYLKRDFSPYIKRFLQHQHNHSPSNRNYQYAQLPAPHSLIQQAMAYPRQVRSNNSVGGAMTTERKKVWIPSGNPASKHIKKFVGYSVRRFIL